MRIQELEAWSPLTQKRSLVSLKRPELQSLAKQLQIKANLKNTEIVDNILGKLSLGTTPTDSPKAGPSNQQPAISAPSPARQDLSPAPFQATYNSPAEEIPRNPSHGVQAGTPLNPLFFAPPSRLSNGGGSGSGDLAAVKRRKTDSSQWVAEKQAELDRMQDSFRRISVPKTTLQPAVIESAFASAAQTTTTTNNAQHKRKAVAPNAPNVPLPAPRAPKPQTHNQRQVPTFHKAQPATRPPPTAGPMTFTAGAAPGPSAQPKRAARPKPAAGARETSKPSTASAAAGREGGTGYASERAKKAAEAFAERMKKAQAAKQGRKM